MAEPNVKIGRSRNGKGVFALRNFKAGQKIFEVKGKLITCDQNEDLDKEIRDNAFRYDAEQYLSPGKRIGRYLNHSCDPNAKVVKIGTKLLIKAVHTIPAGSEVAFDYSTLQAGDDVWTMKCNCGTKHCRKIVKNFHTLPKKIREQYIKLGMVPKYILNN